MDNNTSLFFLIFNLSNRWASLDFIMIFGAETLIYLVFILTLVLAFKGRSPERKAIILAIVSLPILVIIIKIIHLFYYENRPFITHQLIPLISYGNDASFPSRHASISSAIAFAYTYYKSQWASLFLLFMLWVGLSRIFVGVHYPLDILGGFIVGIISLVISKQIIKLIKNKFLIN